MAYLMLVATLIEVCNKIKMFFHTTFNLGLWQMAHHSQVNCIPCLLLTCSLLIY